MKTKKMTRSQFLGTTIGIPLITLSGSNKGFFLKSEHESFQVNEKIMSDREAGLKYLKPSKKDLEHGLELHRNSLVMETYGFMPRAAPDGDAFASKMKENASPIELQDMQEEMIMTRFADNPKEFEEFKNAWEASGVTCVFQNAAEESNDIEVLLKRLANFTYSTDMMRDFVRRAVTPEDIIQARKENRHALYFSGNGVPIPQDWKSLEEELRYIKVFFKLGIRMMHLTYNRRNMIGDGCGEKANAGLSDFGRAVVKEMNRVGVIVDISHSGWQTSLEAAQNSQRPMVASHSCAASINPHMRSKPDNVIKAIADTGGYIGICCIPLFLGGSGDITTMMQHIDYVVKKFGFDHVGIGTDVSYNSRYGDEEYNKIGKGTPTRPGWEAFWPAGSYPRSANPEAVKSMAWTNWPLFTVGMVQMGYSDENIQKILGGNAIRVAKAALT